LFFEIFKKTLLLQFILNKEGNEEDIPTIEAKEKEQAWIQESHDQCKWTQGS